MKAVSLLFMMVAALSLLLCMILGIMDKLFPIGNIAAHSFLQLTGVCLLFSIAISIFKKTDNK
jgi:hypothetical protein